MRTFLKACFTLAVLAGAPLLGLALVVIWTYRARLRGKRDALNRKLVYALTRLPPVDSDLWDRRRALTEI